ncbi:MAG TPA: LysM peptidoglycan-binding domain-containing protein [Steroidobacteraceae bacterium]|nr:LysM peptidoglycan-binding domain-containing protein [Steroidobacteraceae bacterium]
MTRLPRPWLVAAAALCVSACAHQPAKPPEREPIVVPAAPAAPVASAPSDAAAAAAGATPSLTMPREWQHHNGEDYDDLFDRLRAGFALDEVQEPAIDQQLAWFEHNPDYLERVFQRGQRYLYHVVTETEARGMPLEFALLPVVESAYEPFAYSVSRAAGMWQFIPGTGTRFGLKQNWWYDGRRDVIESTRAALDYLQALHDQFDGDWLLAIAAYNVGENSVQRELDYNRAHGKPADFWHLKLPAETRAYVPKLLALKRLMAEPERYGLEFAPIPNEPYFAVIDTNSQIDLNIAAQLAGTNYDELVALNPGYNRWATDPEGPHRMLVPIDNADGFEAALKALPPDDRVRYALHEVTRRETLAMIAKQYGVSATVISKLNDLKGGKVSAGESLKIPEIRGQLPDKVLLAASRVDRPQSEGGRRQRQIVYRVRAGETLSSIARSHGIPVSTLARLNNMGTADTLVKGQRLVIKASTRRYRDEGVVSGRRVLYTVRRGDTVYSISRQYQVSVSQLKSWNGLNQHHQIRAGQRLVMYVDSNRQQG